MDPSSNDLWSHARDGHQGLLVVGGKCTYEFGQHFRRESEYEDCGGDIRSQMLVDARIEDRLD